jgi:predicted PurR-regulated permease PerM
VEIGRNSAQGKQDVAPESPVLNLIATILVFAALAFMGPVVAPLAFAITLSVAVSPLADRIERVLPSRAFSSLACTLLLAGLLLGSGALLSSQVAAIVSRGDEYLIRLGDVAGRLTESTGSHRMLRSVGVLREQVGNETLDATPEAQEEARARTAREWVAIFRRNAAAVGGWVVSGLGGLVGFLASSAICLSLIFYMLLQRSRWMDRIKTISIHLGMRPRLRELEKVRADMGRYVRVLFALCAFYGVVMTVLLSLLGVPNALLWGILTGLLEVVPFFGPFIAGTLTTLFIIGTGGSLWQMLAVIAVFTALQALEQYLVAPKLFGGAVDLDPVTVIVAVLFFGLLLGPAGLALALPIMILLKGMVAVTPDTPVLDALLEPEGGGDDSASGRASRPHEERTAPA